jgi:hypothetical protein
MRRLLFMDRILDSNLEIKKAIHQLQNYNIPKTEIISDIKSIILESSEDRDHIYRSLDYIQNIKDRDDDGVIQGLNELILKNEEYVRENININIEDYNDMVVDTYFTMMNLIYETFNDIYTFESDYIQTLVENLTIVLEDPKPGYEISKNIASGTAKAGKAIVKGASTVWDALMGLILSVQEAFLSKHKKITERDLRWLKENESKLRQLDTNHIEINIHSDFKKRLADARTVYNSYTSIIENNINTFKDYEAFRAKMKPFTDSNNDLKAGLMNRYRTGSSNSPYTIINMKGKAIQNAIPDLITYCRDFIAEYNNMNKMCKDSEAFIKRLQKESRLKGVKESYCYIEESLYCETDLGLFYDFDIVTEEEQTGVSQNSSSNNSQNNTNTTNEPKKDEKKVGVEQRVDAREQIDGMDKNTISLYNKICRDKHLGMTSFMTASEKKYFESITILRGLLRNQQKQE